MYIDPFHSDLETPISDLRNQLNLLGASAIDQTPFLEESSNSEIALRCGKNILNSVQHVTHFDGPHITPLDITSAKYAGLWSSILLCGPSRAGERRFYLSWLMELFATEFLWDAHLIEEYLAPLFQNMPEYDQILECLHVIRAADEMPKQVRRRTAAHEGVRYRIGQVFQHRRYNYVATITGWDAECDAGEEWMIRMGVDRLPAGRHQSFYHVL